MVWRANGGQLQHVKQRPRQQTNANSAHTSASSTLPRNAIGGEREKEKTSWELRESRTNDPTLELGTVDG